MPSILIYGGNPQTREKKAEELLREHQVYRVGEKEKKVSIKEIRELLPHLHRLPLKSGGKKGVLIGEAQRLTPEAQNALLKTLEEPPSFLTFVLTTPHPRLLLSTVSSRCLKLTAEEPNPEKSKPDRFSELLLAADPGRRLALFEEKVGYEYGAVTSFLDAFEIELSQLPKDKNFAQILPKIWETKKLLRDPSANLKLTIDRLLLCW